MWCTDLIPRSPTTLAPRHYLKPDPMRTYCQMDHGPLTRYVNCELRMRRECRECFPHHRFQRKSLVSDPDIHHGTCATWCMWRGKCSRHSRRMRNPQFCISGKRPIGVKLHSNGTVFIEERMMLLKMSSVKWQPFCLCFSVLIIMIISNMFSLIKQYNGWRDLSTRSREISQPLNFYS